jgi:uncharacterized membrane protein YgdD (TMEM256/DUF423 family)
MAKWMIVLGSLNAFLSVALGAFGAHGLKSKLATDMMAIYETGVQYHMVHSLGLLLIGILLRTAPQSNLLNWSGLLLLAGIVIFSGSLYALSITGIRGFGAITPIGGLSFLLGWVLLAVAAIKHL